MPTPFPGMDPYLERPDLWPNVHHSLIIALRDDLAPRLRPRYYVAVEERTYIGELPGRTSYTAYPDVSIIGETAVRYAPAVSKAVTVELPAVDEIRETYLEIQDLESGDVVTVIEILSPTNKRPGRGRTLYERKRRLLLPALTHLVEIDLLRGGEPPTMRGRPDSHYAILISRWQHRPQADLLPFNVPQPIPRFHLPLQEGDREPEVNLNHLLHDLYDRAGFDLRIDYTAAPEPPLGEETAGWAAELLQKRSTAGE